MFIINEKTLIDFLALQNRWWYDKKDFPLEKTNKFKRSDYSHLYGKSLGAKEATVIIGPRGVGKSTVMFEIIRELLGVNNGSSARESNIDGRRIIYATFEDPSVRKSGILEILGIYSKYILKEDISRLGGKIHVFFDEIQNLEDWGSQIKAVQDLGYPIKFFLTGSSSVAMMNESSKAARRLSLYMMQPMKFSDFARYKDNDTAFEEVLGRFKEARQVLKASFGKKDPHNVYEMFLRFYGDFKPWQGKIEISFREYMIKGGYPAFLGNEDYVQCSAQLNETFRLGFHKDMVIGSGVRDPRGIMALTEYIASISSGRTNYRSLMEHANIASNSREMRKYLYQLETSMLVGISRSFTKIAGKSGSEFKIYLTDIAVRNMLVGMMNELLFKDEVQLGYMIETLVYDHILRLNHKFLPGSSLSYWNGKKQGEVDIIMNPGSLIPVEVKKEDSPSLPDVGGLRTFEKKHGVPGIVICGKKLALEENTVFVPSWLFVLMC